MKVGILGYNGVGKTTVFSALTGMDVSTSSPGEKHLGTVDVIDRRLDHLRDVFQPKKFTRARFDVEDMPAIPQGDVKGKAELLSNLREPEALLVVIGCFEQARMLLDSSIGEPAAQLSALKDDLLLLDLEMTERRLQRIEERYQKKPAERPALENERTFVKSIQAILEQGGNDLPETSDRDQLRILAEMRLFMAKPMVVVFNVDEAFDLKSEDAGTMEGLAPYSAVLCATVEQEIAQIAEGDRAAFLEEYNLEAPASERLTRLAYTALNLISFFTVGQDEVRAWPLPRESTAPTAAGKVHTDLERGFIRAETVPYDRVKDTKDERGYKEVSKAELKGKDYIVQDGDILNIRSGI